MFLREDAPENQPNILTMRNMAKIITLMVTIPKKPLPAIAATGLLGLF